MGTSEKFKFLQMGEGYYFASLAKVFSQVQDGMGIGESTNYFSCGIEKYKRSSTSLSRWDFPFLGMGRGCEMYPASLNNNTEK